MKYTRKQHKTKENQTRQRGGEKKGLSRQLGHRNLFNPIKKKVAFKNNVNVREYNVDKIKRPIGNKSKTRTRKLLKGTPHKINANYQQLVSSLYGKISESANTRENMYLTIQELFENINNDASINTAANINNDANINTVKGIVYDKSIHNDNIEINERKKIKKILEHKVKRNHFS